MIDLTTEFGQRVNQRLSTEEVIWFTTVTPSGVSQPNPVWFYWYGEVNLVYSEPGSYRIQNIQHNNAVALNLEGANGLGENVVVLQGTAEIKYECKQANPGFEKKYSAYFPILGTTIDQIIRKYSVEITIRLKKMRGA